MRIDFPLVSRVISDQPNQTWSLFLLNMLKFENVISSAKIIFLFYFKKYLRANYKVIVVFQGHLDVIFGKCLFCNIQPISFKLPPDAALLKKPDELILYDFPFI